MKDVRVVAGFSTKIEVECRSTEDATDAAAAGAEVVMLDNFSPEVSHKSSVPQKQLATGGSIGVTIYRRKVTMCLEPI